MKVRFGVSARNLPNRGDDVYASLSAFGKQFGQSEVIRDDQSPIWKKVFFLECENVEDVDVDVSILSANNGREIGRAQFSVAAILTSKRNVVQKNFEDGSSIFACAFEHIIDQSAFMFKIQGKNLVNQSRAKHVVRLKSDPFYEVRSSSSNLVYTSEVQESDLDPDWCCAEVGLQSLCKSDFDVPIEISVYDQDRRKKHKLMGSFQTTVNDLMVAAAYGKSINLLKNGEITGTILVQEAKCLGLADMLWRLEAAASARKLSETTALVAASAEKAIQVQKKAQLNAEARQKSVQEASAVLAQAQVAAEKAKAASMAAADERAKIRKRPVGTLKFKFEGKGLKKVGAVGFIGKSDPFFVLQKAASEGDEEIEWCHIYISDVVRNSVDPAWKVSEVDIGDLCSNNLDEAIRIVIFDWNKSGEHKLIGYIETSINGIISAQRAEVEIPLMHGADITGLLAVPYAEVDGFIDPKKAEEKAEELAKQADHARFFALGAEHRAKDAMKRAEEAQNEAKRTKQCAETAQEEAGAANRNTVIANIRANQVAPSPEIDQLPSSISTNPKASDGRPILRRSAQNLGNMKPEGDPNAYDGRPTLQRSAQNLGDIIPKRPSQSKSVTPWAEDGSSKIARSEKKYRFGDITRGIVAVGKEKAGRDTNSPYKFGDFTRGLVG